MTEQRNTEKRFVEDVDYDDAAMGEMLFNAEREQVYHSQREMSCQRRQSVARQERGVQVLRDAGRPIVERGQEQNTEQAQIWVFFQDNRGRTNKMNFTTEHRKIDKDTIEKFNKRHPER